MLVCVSVMSWMVSFHARGASGEAAVGATLERLVAHNHGFGGGVVRIAGPEGLIYEAAAGNVAGPGSAGMRPETPFEVASITKAVTAATVLRLVEAGRLSLDMTLGEALPGEAARGFDGKITLRQLLSHTSGLGHYWTDGARDRAGNNAFLTAFLAEPGRTWSAERILGYAREIPARRAGAGFRYSDTNYVLLGLIVERVTGKPLQRVYREMVFEPLGMRDTWLTYREGRRGAEVSHRYEGREDLHEVPRQSADWAGGGLVSTARDLEKFLRGLASGRLFKSAETLEVMRRAVPVGEPGISYGLGLYRVKLDAGQGELWGHDGHGNSFAYYWPQRGITFTGTLNQTENDWWPLVEAFINKREPEVDFGAEERSWSAMLAAGWDSLYMDRGANALGGQGRRYGSGIQWTDVTVTYALTERDYVTLDAWLCFATQGTAYRELDTTLEYTRLEGPFSLSAGYDFSYGYAEGSFYSHELRGVVAYDYEAGPVTLTPSVTGTLNLGPDSDDGNGFAKAGSGFVTFRLDGNVPLYRGVLALEPWAAFGLNLGYNTRGEGENEEAFNGANNLECGVALPWRVTGHVTLAVYGAYSYACTNITGTEPSTFWGGASVTLAY